ncbi:acyl-CoA reductase [Marinobacterium zhoushanense]|uniref:Acyl-CoA reductase n=1 Tax=Marinobacterium zhoushanense TaxID=1679163 RepID=A0ABQ1KS91_9GAMM|nr:acyl-CoA reductase [Marinobacterium zhoushanense]GGC07603.1 acyl-CoA reductase [Marinobacterium zhoushanense]
MKVLFPRSLTMDRLEAISPAPAWRGEVRGLLGKLSEKLMSEPSATLKALGFWLRPAHLKQMALLVDGTRMRPRGKVLQVAPGNVDTLFIYVALLALWLGNVVVVRLSSRQGEDEARLLDILHALAETQCWSEELQRLVLVRCEYDDPDWTAQMSSADMRIFWGSDNTIRRLSTVPKPSHCIDLGMGHKHSLCLLHAKKVLDNKDGQLAALFLRDTLEFAQQGCASPRTLIWFGSASCVAAAQEVFWPAVEEVAKDFIATGRYQLDDASALERLSGLQQLALDGCVHDPWQRVGCLVRLPVEELSQRQELGHPAHGVVYEWAINDLSELAAQLKPWHQTLSYFGWDRSELTEWATHQAVLGLDRIESVGQALIFHPIWDGLNLLQQLGRQLR